MATLLKFLTAISLCLFLQFSCMDAKVVVLFSLPHAANVRTHTNVGRALTEMGHDAYVCIPHFMMKEKTANVNGIKVIEYGERLGNVDDTLAASLGQSTFDQGEPSIFDMLNMVGKFQNLVREILSDQELITKLKSVKPDLFVITTMPPAVNFVILPYSLGVPFAFMSPFYDIVGQRVPFSPSATSCPLMPSFVEHDPSLLDRLKNFACIAAMVGADFYFPDQKMLAEFAPNRPQIPIHDLIRKMEVFIVEGDHILDYAKPELPNMKLVGCTAPTPARPLKEPFKGFVEKATNGLAVVTFGSGVVDLPEHVAQKMIKAFEQQNLQIVWRVNVTSPNPSKILTSRWVPQNDILAHKNTKLFVSHCGANGQYESLYHGVPILCLPLFGDQFYNAHRSTSKGFGLSGNLKEISDKELSELMKEVAENPKYKNNMQKASNLFRKLYKYPVKEAAFWIDHVMEYGGDYMRSAGQEMPLYQFLVLDILAVFLFVIVFFVLLIFCLCRCCCRLCKKSSGSQMEKKKGKRD